jgi:hypothetical protein
MGKIERIQVAPEDRERLVRLVRDRNTPQKIVWRSQIVLLAGEGMGAAPHYGALTIFRLILRHVLASEDSQIGARVRVCPNGHQSHKPLPIFRSNLDAFDLAAARRQLECHLSWRSGTYARSTKSGTTRRLDRQRSLLYALHHRDHARALAGQTQLVGHRIELGLP